MADVKPATVRNPTSLTPARVEPQVRVTARPPIQARTAIEEPESRITGSGPVDPSNALVSDFIAPASRTTAWLTSPRLTATLEAASQALAPNGSTEDPIDRYAASVVETHLVARRKLTTLMNSLLKT